MTDEVPDWASDDVPWAPVHQEQQDQLQRPFTQQELQEFGKQFIEQFLRRVVLAVAGSFLPNEAAFDQLQQWALNIPFVGDIINFIKTTTGIDLSSPQALITSLGNLIANGGKLPSVFSISRIGDIVQDLINGAGAFLNADSVSPGSPWSWDSVMPGWKSGGSIRATANGTQQVLRADEVFEVFENQTLKIKDAAARWTGATAAAGSNPIKVGWTPYDADGNAMADVIKGTLQPSGDSAGWVPFTVSDWTVPAGVSHATTLVILDSGATAGNVWISNVLPYASQLGDQSLIKDLPGDLQDLADGIAANVVALATKLAQGDFDGFLSALMNGGATTSTAITNKFQFLDSAGKFDVTQLLGLLAQNQVTGLPDMQTALNQLGDIFNGLVVTPINAGIGFIQSWFTGNKNKTQGLNSSGQLGAGSVTGTFPQSQIANLVSDLGGKAAASALATLQTYVNDFVNAILQAIRGVPVVGGTLANIISEVGGLNSTANNAATGVSQVADGITNGWSGGSSSGTNTNVYDTLAAVRASVASGYTIDTFTSNGTWTKPANLIEFYGIVIGGGGRGMSGFSNTSNTPASGGAGGSSGGYLAKQIDPADVPSSISITIGPAATLVANNGGITSIGSLLSSVPNGSGVATLTGYMSSSSTPGQGGTGGNGAFGATTNGTNGLPSAVGAGGLGSAGVGGTGAAGNQTASAGQNGGSVSLTDSTKCGGGGGGGGGGAQGAGSGTSTGGNGGNGGYPGGGSGGGGGASRGGSFGAASGGVAGTPANGCAFIIWKGN